MASKISAGKYPARVVDYGIKPPKTEGKAPQVQIVFEFADDDGEAHEYSWFGSLHENAVEFTLKSLLLCGLKSNLGSIDEIMAFNKGKGSGQLDELGEVHITVKMKQKYGAPDGEMIPEIAFINDSGGSGMRERLAQGDLVKTMSGFNLGGKVAALRQEMPKKKEPETKKPPNFAPTF